MGRCGLLSLEGLVDICIFLWFCQEPDPETLSGEVHDEEPPSSLATMTLSTCLPKLQYSGLSIFHCLCLSCAGL